MCSALRFRTHKELKPLDIIRRSSRRTLHFLVTVAAVFSLAGSALGSICHEGRALMGCFLGALDADVCFSYQDFHSKG